MRPYVDNKNNPSNGSSNSLSNDTEETQLTLLSIQELLKKGVTFETIINSMTILRGQITELTNLVEEYDATEVDESLYYQEWNGYRSTDQYTYANAVKQKRDRQNVEKQAIIRKLKQVEAGVILLSQSSKFIEDDFFKTEALEMNLINTLWSFQLVLNYLVPSTSIKNKMKDDSIDENYKESLEFFEKHKNQIRKEKESVSSEKKLEMVEQIILMQTALQEFVKEFEEKFDLKMDFSSLGAIRGEEFSGEEVILISTELFPNILSECKKGETYMDYRPPSPGYGYSNQGNERPAVPEDIMYPHRIIYGYSNQGMGAGFGY